MGLYRRLVNVFRPSRLDRELAEEIEFHREMRERRAREAGKPEPEARKEAIRKMGNVTLSQEQMRDARVVGWLSSCVRDIRHGIALLHRDRGVSAMIVAVLALGIGGNTAIFTIMKAAFLDPLPYRDAERLITITEVTGWNPSVSGYREIRERNRSLEAMAFAQYTDMQVSGTAEATRVYGARVTASFFPLLGANAALGRTFTDAENQPGSALAVVLTDRLWRTRMASDPAIIGRLVRLDGKPAEVVGVLAPDFHFDHPGLRITEPVDLYAAFQQPATTRVEVTSTGRGTPVRVLGRTKPGVTFEQARADIHRVARELTTEYPKSFPNPQNDPSLFTYETTLLHEAIARSQRPALWLLGGATAILLLIACANTAQLLIARSARRRREAALRLALGASRGRLVRQFLLEGLVLAACGGVIGLPLAHWLARLLIGLQPAGGPLRAGTAIDGTVAAFTAAVSLISALVFAIVPALEGTRVSLTARASAGEGNGWRHAMIGVEAALSVFLLCGAGLVARNLLALHSAPLGFDPSNVAVMRLQLPGQSPESVRPGNGAILQEYVDRISAIPGVESAATVTGPPLRPARSGNAELVGITESNGRLKSIIKDNHLVSPGYFETMRIPLLAGRTFHRGDSGKVINAAVVNEEFARQFGFGTDIVGQQIFEPGTPITIVGVVGNVRTRGLRTAPVAEAYLSSLQLSWPNVYLVVRSTLPLSDLTREVRRATGLVNPDQAVFGVTSMDQYVHDSFSQPRFDAYVTGAFSALAFLMAIAGTYSVVSCLVAQRTAEIAIRIALGAGGRDIVRHLAGDTARWIVAGVGLGLVAAVAASSVVRSMANSAVSDSPVSYAFAATVFLVAAAVAALRPLRAATMLPPSLALRAE